ncbi:phage holin family protein [Chitinilyticum litopenaei]|uniref:phage holin family protein n=1 Tax=Chitinilyticum litopenaei TaxID=1121276 RepID=UPI0006850BC8|nr:phage holin family protein [Chitinilyticum litopenaei]
MSDYRQRLREFSAHALGLCEVSAELFAIELQEAIETGVSGLFWLGVIAVFGGLACLLLSVLLLIIFWETHRIMVASSLCAAYLAVAVFAFWQVRQKLRAGRCLFACSLAELRAAIAMLNASGGRADG